MMNVLPDRDRTSEAVAGPLLESALASSLSHPLTVHPATASLASCILWILPRTNFGRVYDLNGTTLVSSGSASAKYPRIYARYLALIWLYRRFSFMFGDC